MQYITFLHVRTRWWILQVFGAACTLVALIASYMLKITISMVYKGRGVRGRCDCSVIPWCCRRYEGRFLLWPSAQVSVPSSIQPCKVIQGCCFSVQEALLRSTHLSLLLLVPYICISPLFHPARHLTTMLAVQLSSPAAVQNAKINFNVSFLEIFEKLFGRQWFYYN